MNTVLNKSHYCIDFFKVVNAIKNLIYKTLHKVKKIWPLKRNKPTFNRNIFRGPTPQFGVVAHMSLNTLPLLLHWPANSPKGNWQGSKSDHISDREAGTVVQHWHPM